MQAPPSPNTGPSSRPPPTHGPGTEQPQPDSPTRARPPPLTLTRRAPRADTAHGRAPRHASPRSGLGPSACRGSGSGRQQRGEPVRWEGVGAARPPPLPGEGTGPVTSRKAWPSRHHQSGRGQVDVVATQEQRTEKKLVLCSGPTAERPTP